jgi:ketosteroid isomerase-like protein
MVEPVTRSNADLVRDAFERWNRREHDLVLREIDPDVEIYVVSAQLLGGGPFRGHDGYREWTAAMEESFDFWQIQPETFREHGDTVVVLGRMHLRGRGSGVELDQETGWVIHVRDGKMIRFQSFLSHEEALAAGGIS